MEVAHRLVLFKVLKSKAGLKTRLLLEFHRGEAHSTSTDSLWLYIYYSIYSPSQEKWSVTLLCCLALSKDLTNVLSLASRARLLEQSWVIVLLVKTLIIIINNAPHNGHLAGCLAATEGLNEKTNTNIFYFEELCQPEGRKCSVGCVCFTVTFRRKGIRRMLQSSRGSPASRQTEVGPMLQSPPETHGAWREGQNSGIYAMPAKYQGNEKAVLWANSWE